MKASKLVEHLQEAVEKLGYKIRIEQGRFRGGSCVHDEEKLVFINRRFGDEERAEILARALAENDYEQVFMIPEARAFVETFVTASTEEQDSSSKADEA